MQISVVGTGNVGSALLIHLMDVPSIDEILVMNIEDDWSNAAIMDAAGANPDAAQKLSVAPFKRLGESDLIVLTSGAQMKVGETPKDVLHNNIKLTKSILDSAPIKKTVIVIALATPVDDITAFIQKEYKLPENQVFGFGGDIDRSRLVYTLKKLGIPVQGVEIVGEHMKRTVPVYKGEQRYEEVAAKVRNFLSHITAHGGSPRNLATGLLLSRLVRSVVANEENLHYVCGYHPEYTQFITWPFTIGRKGVLKAQSVTFGSASRKNFETLLEQKKKEIIQ